MIIAVYFLIIVPQRHSLVVLYRDIVLGEQIEPVYEPTNNSEIAMAFREAGNPDAT